MKKLLTLAILVLSVTAFGQTPAVSLDTTTKTATAKSLEEVERLTMVNLVSERELVQLRARGVQTEAEKFITDSNARFADLNKQIAAEWEKICKKYKCDPQKDTFDSKTGKIVPINQPPPKTQ